MIRGVRLTGWLLAFWSHTVIGGFLPADTPVPGGIALVELPSAAATARVTYEGHRVLVRPNGSKQVAVVGIPLGASPGRHQLTIDDGEGSRSVSFAVHPHSYPEQRITIANPAMVTPDTEQLQRIRREQSQMRDAFATYSSALPATLAFTPPVSGEVSGAFGLRRFFNDQPRRPHSGIDFAAPRGTPVRAPAAGRILATGDYYFNGKTVLMDHGEGLVTMYCHLDAVQVEPGQTIATGEPVGTVGSTGRATGPHLHWSVSMNGARVDPALLLRLPE